MMRLKIALYVALLSFAVGGDILAGPLPALTTVRVANGLVEPLFVTHAPDDFDRIFIVEQPGRIRILENGLLLGTSFLDITGIVRDTGNEEGLLGLAIHPDHGSNGLFYVYYINNAGNIVVAEYSTTANPNIADAGSANILLTIPHPTNTNHNGGWIGFGPGDGFLYIAVGDGGSFCGPGENSQDITGNLLGKLLRIDVGAGGGFTIPADNPFVGVTGDDEIWAYGLRNPWRCAFDRATSDLYIADVGQGEREEINFQAAGSLGGENYGWDCKEGVSCATISGCGAGGCSCVDASLVDPLRQYTHTFGCSITGGEVYRGCAIPGLEGTYFFADVCSSRIWRTQLPGGGLSSFTEIQAELDPPGALAITQITSFGVDAFGEVYIVDRGGEVFKIVPAAGPFNDCNTNTIEDACEILDGSELDTNPMNGVPDTCEAGIPTVSQWGTIVMMLALAAAGTLVFRSRAYVSA